MISTRFIKISTFATSLLMWAGCSAPAYVLNEGEFDRELATFGKGIEDRSDVTICYSKRGTTPAEIGRLAGDECRRFGRTAIFKEQTYQTCPLMTPIAAEFFCLAPGEKLSDLKR